MLPPGLTLLTQSAVAVLTYNSQDFAKTQVGGWGWDGDGAVGGKRGACCQVPHTADWPP